MDKILLPSKVEFEEGALKNQATVIVSPCYYGYGTTLGNSLRRVLLSSLPGAAVEAFKIKGVQHEFSTVDGVKEDVVEIMLNLKQLAVKVFSEEPVILNITKKGTGAVTAADIEKNAQVEIINKDLVLMHLTGGKTFEMEIVVGRGRGFKPVEEKDRQNYDLGTIVIDSIYTPVKDVGYKVEYTRVGDITNFEKLLLNIETNGTVSPRAALLAATEILMDHFTVVLNATEGSDEIAPLEEKKEVKEEGLEVTENVEAEVKPAKVKKIKAVKKITKKK